MQIALHDVIGALFTVALVVFGFLMKRSFNKALDALDSIPGLTKELKSIADEMKDSKIQIAKIAVLESALQTAFKKLDELRSEHNEYKKKTDEVLIILRERSHEHANHLTKMSGRVDLIWRDRKG